MVYLGDKHWDVWVYDTALWPVVTPVLARHFDTTEGDADVLPTDLPGLHHDGEHANTWRYDGSLSTLRLRVLCDHLQTALVHFDVWSGDPVSEGEWTDPAIDRAALTDGLARLLRGAHDKNPANYTWPVTDPHLAPLVARRNLDDFAEPTDPDRLAADLAKAVTEAVESGAVTVTASEPYDSCAGCGGYHNVNLGCS